MTTQKDRIEAAIRHIQTAADVDPWAMELAVDALKAQGTCEDAVSRQTLQKELALYLIDDVTSEDEAWYNRAINDVQKMILHLPSAQSNLGKYEYHYDHTDCIWYRPEARNRCPVTCAQYRDGWNDAMNYIFRDGKGYMPYRRDKQYGE